MRKYLLFLISMGYLQLFTSCNNPDENRAFIASKYWVEKLVPAQYGELDFPFGDYRYDDIKNGEYIIESYFNCKSGKITYRAKMKYNGEGSPSDYNNWELLKIDFPNTRY